MHGPLHVVFNAAAGSQDTAEVRAIVEAVFTEAGQAFRMWNADTPGELGAVAQRAVAAARESGGAVVAAGGDGTINTVARATLGSGCRFGVLPQGTFNYLARAHDIPADPEQAARALLDGHTRPLQVGLVGDRVFLVNASVGLYPQLLEDREAYKKQFGRSRLVALGAALATFLRERRQLRLTIEAEGEAPRRVRTPTVFVGSNRLQLEQIGIADAPAVDAGRLVVITVKPAGAMAMLAIAARGAFGRLGEADEVSHFATRSLTLSPARGSRPRRMKVATDGEVAWLVTPLHFSVSPEPLQLIVPAVASVAAAPEVAELRAGTPP